MPLIQWIIQNLQGEVNEEAFLQCVSSLQATADIKPRPKPQFEEDRWNLAGVYAILPALGNNPKFVEIKFTFNDATYDKMFYSEGRVKAEVESINLIQSSRFPLMEIENASFKTSELPVPTIVLENIGKYG